MTKNENSTRYHSNLQEQYVADLLDGRQQSNSGAGHFNKGDVIVRNASLLVECKTQTSDKDAMSIKKEWIETVNTERRQTGLENWAVAIKFGPSSDNYFVINEKLMRFLVEKLSESS